MALLGVVAPALQEGLIFFDRAKGGAGSLAVTDAITTALPSPGCGPESLQPLLHLAGVQQAQQFGATAGHPFGAGLLLWVAAAGVVQGHGRAHRQVAQAEVHHRGAHGAQGQHQRLGQPIQQRAVPGQAHREEAAAAVAANHQFGHPIGQHLIAYFAIFP